MISGVSREQEFVFDGFGEVWTGVAGGHSCLLLAGGPELLDDFFRCVSFLFHDESGARLATGTLITDGSISRERPPRLEQESPHPARHIV